MLIDQIKEVIKALQKEKLSKFKRRVSLGDLLTERDENARAYGFGDGTTMYDSVLVLGDVKVGKNCWIGPNVILDGSGGGLHIGDFCSIAAGTQIYTHHTVKWAISGGVESYEVASTRIGSRVFIGPNTVIAKGVTIGDEVVIGAFSFVNKDVSSGVKIFGQPARIMGPSDQASVQRIPKVPSVR